MFLFYFLEVCALLLTFPCLGQDIKYENFSSIEEVISFETQEILATPLKSYDEQADAYFSRAESLLLCQKNEAALQDYDKGLALIFRCVEREPLEFRGHFGAMIAFLNLGFEQEAYKSYEVMKAILQKTSEECYLTRNISKKNQQEGNRPIIGPDHVSVQDCIEFAEGTARQARLLISYAKPNVHFTLNLIIDQLEDTAKRCCRAGGIWKGCLQPLVNKWYQWNQKWMVFGVPPDPAWD